VRVRAAGVVRDFLDDLKRIRSALAESDSADSFWSVWARVRAGALPRIGTLAENIRYRVHGFGCRFTDGNGIMVDVDFAPDGTVLFDPWRVAQNAQSRGIEERLNQNDLDAALADLVYAGELRVVEDRWYSLHVS
jgi:hypothetical protein